MTFSFLLRIKCCVYTCNKIYKGRKIEGDENNNMILMFHRFPKNIEQKAKWINNIRKINGSIWEPKNTSFVCSVSCNLVNIKLVY